MSVQLTLRTVPAIERPRYGYEHQALALIAAVGDGIWRSLAQIESELNFRYSQTGISARIRDIRKGLVFGWSAERKVEEGRNFYRVKRA